MRQLKVATKNGADVTETIATTKVKKSDLDKMTLMKHFAKIVDITKDAKFSDESIKKAQPYTKTVAERLSLTDSQALFLSVFIDQCDDELIRMRDVAQHFNCRNIEMLCYDDDIEELVNRNYIRKSSPNRHNRNLSYRVPHDVVSALKKNAPYSKPSINNLTIQEFFNQLSVLFDEAYNGEMEVENLTSNINDLIEANPNLHICKETKKYGLDDCVDSDEREVVLLMFFCHRLINENDDNIGMWDIERIFNKKCDFNSIKRSFKRGCHALIIQNIVETKKGSDLLERDIYCLTDDTKEKLLVELELKIETKSKPKDIIKVEDIASKSLYYNHREQEQIKQLTTLLGTDNFTNVQQRLTNNGMRKGFACLFYGVPGTGKTETVYQIAKQTGRDIMMVNVSDIKSMWVGESEKNIKGLFERYRNFTKQSTQTPILLFNEADAVLGVRQQGAERAVDKMENSIQNIILQEMESLDGIMIATTNLTQNLDKAFERRFLYKIEFDKPSFEAKSSIWQSMMPSLLKDEVDELARCYEFSGGQIENIARKRTVETIINGSEPTLEMIHTFCKSEQLYKTNDRRPIGF